MHLCSGRALRLQSWSCCVLQNQTQYSPSPGVWQEITQDTERGRSTTEISEIHWKRTWRREKTRLQKWLFPVQEQQAGKCESACLKVQKLACRMLSASQHRDQSWRLCKVVRKRKVKSDTTHLICRYCSVLAVEAFSDPGLTQTWMWSKQ